MTPHDRWDIVIKAVALAGAGLFFVYRALAGGLAASASVSLSAERLDAERVALSILIARGSLWSLAIEEMTVTTFGEGLAAPKVQAIPFIPAERKQYYLAPDERMQLGMVMALPEGKPYVLAVRIRTMQQGLGWTRIFGDVAPVAYFHGSLVVPPKGRESVSGQCG